MVPCLLTMTDLQTRRAGLSASAELLVSIPFLRATRSFYILLPMRLLRAYIGLLRAC